MSSSDFGIQRPAERVETNFAANRSFECILQASQVKRRFRFGIDDRKNGHKRFEIVFTGSVFMYGLILDRLYGKRSGKEAIR